MPQKSNFNFWHQGSLITPILDSFINEFHPSLLEITLLSILRNDCSCGLRKRLGQMIEQTLKPPLCPAAGPAEYHLARQKN